MHELMMLIVLWIGAGVFAFAAFMAWGMSIRTGDLEDKLGCLFPVLILAFAFVLTVLDLLHVIHL